VLLCLFAANVSVSTTSLLKNIQGVVWLTASWYAVLTFVQCEPKTGQHSTKNAVTSQVTVTMMLKTIRGNDSDRYHDNDNDTCLDPFHEEFFQTWIHFLRSESSYCG